MNLSSVIHSRQKWPGIRRISSWWQFPEEYSDVSAYIQNQDWVLDIFMPIGFSFPSWSHWSHSLKIPKPWLQWQTEHSSYLSFRMLVKSLSALHVMVQSTAVLAETLENCRLLCLLCSYYLKGGMTLTNRERADWEGPALSWALCHMPPFIPQ